MTVRADCVCSRRLDVDRNLAGRWVECPDCKRQVHVPGLVESEPPAPAVPLEHARPARQPTESPKPGPVQPTAELPVVQADQVEAEVIEPIAESDSDSGIVSFEPAEPKPKEAKPKPATTAKDRPKARSAKPPRGYTMCPFCGANVRQREDAEMLHCLKCDSDFSDLPEVRRKKRKKKPKEPKSKFRAVKQVVRDNRESFPLWGKWLGVVGVTFFGFIVIIQIFAKTASNIEREGLEEAVVNGIQNRYREKRMSQPTLPTVQINNLETEEKNADGLIPFRAERKTVIVEAGTGQPIYGLIDAKAGRWVFSTIRIESMDSPDVEMAGEVSVATRSAYGALTFIILASFFAAVLLVAWRYVF